MEVDENNPAMAALLPGNAQPPANGIAIQNDNNNINLNINRAQHNRIGFFNRFRRLFRQNPLLRERELPVVNLPKIIKPTNHYNQLEDELGDLIMEDIIINDGIDIVKDDHNNVKIKVNKVDIEVSLETYRQLEAAKNRIMNTPANLRDRIKAKMIKSLSKTIDISIISSYLVELENEEHMGLDYFEAGDGTNDMNTQTVGNMEIQVDEGDIIGTTKTSIPKRKEINKKVKNLDHINSLTPLTYHLKCKYFMSLRTVELINNMVRDSRIWMSANKYNLNNQDDYYLMTQSVMAAFLIDEQELKFRQLLKNRSNFDNMAHLNNTLSGNLGRTNRLFPLRERGILSSVAGAIGLTTANKFPINTYKV